MSRLCFQIKITGPQPDQVSVRTLAEVLTGIDATIAEVVKSSGLAVPPDGPTLSLVDVDEGSDVLTFSILDDVAPAVSTISGAISRGAYSDLPRAAHKELFEVAQRVLGSGWGLEILGNPEAGIPPSRISPDRGVSPPPDPDVVRGTSTLLARCLRVGGATTPKAEVRVVQGGRALNLTVSESLAKQLGGRLYEEVLLQGEAVWELPSWRLVDFKVSEILDFDRTSPAEAFQELSKKAGDAWDEVDALEFVRQQRGEG